MMLTAREILSQPVASVAETMQITKLSKTQVHRMVQDGSLDSVRVGKRVLIKTGSIKRLLKIRD